VQVDAHTFARTYHSAGNVHLVDLHVGEGSPATRAFISSVSRDPVSHAVTHVDFHVVNLLLEITAHVPITLTGDAPAVKQDLGVLLQLLENLTVKVLPTAVPEQVEADVSALDELGAAIHAGDIPLPPGVTLITDPEEVVARISAITVVPEEEEEAAEAAEGEAAEGETAEGEAESDEGR